MEPDQTVIKQKPACAYFITQFLGAFNDNAFKMFLIVLGITYTIPASEQARYLSLVALLFTLPFILFSPYAGFFSDKYSKSRLIQILKLAECIIMTCGFVALYFQNVPACLFTLFLMGAQSAFFSPAKYGILPEITSHQELSNRNGILELTTFMAIITGQAFGGILFSIFPTHIHFIPLAFIVISIAGIIAASKIPHTPPQNIQSKFLWNPFKEIHLSFQKTKEIDHLMSIILAISFFWFIGAYLQLLIPYHSSTLMTSLKSENVLTALLVSLSIGIGAGSFVAGKFSDHQIEFSFLPLGSLIINISLLAGLFTHHSFSAQLLTYLMAGIGGGFFILPLLTYLQSSPPESVRGKLIAFSNFLSFIAIAVSSLCFNLVTRYYNSTQTLGIITSVTFVATLAIFYKMPFTTIRLMVLCLTKIFYRTRVSGQSNIPEQGGALIVANHVSFLDWAFLSICTERPIRFLIYKEFFRIPVLGYIFRKMNAIPISEKDSPKEIILSLNLARKALDQGELVCIFPEGQISRTGQLLSFKQGVSHIMKHRNEPIIPIHIDQLWGSIFSFKNGKFFYKKPESIPYPVTVTIGAPLMPSTPTLQLRQHILSLEAQSFESRDSLRQNIGQKFIHNAKKHFFLSFLSDSKTKYLTYGQTLALSIMLKNTLKLHLNDHEKNVGIVLPPSVAGFITNFALCLNQNISVNLNPTLSKNMFEACIQKSDIKTLITTRKVMEKISFPENLNILFIEDLISDKPTPAFILLYLKLMILPATRITKILRLDHISPTSVLTIIFSSGSTSTPKGICLSHRNVMANIEGLRQCLPLHKNDKILGTLPFFHSFGYTGTLMLPGISPLKIFYFHDPLNAREIGHCALEHKPTLMIATPTFLMTYFRKIPSEHFKTLHTVIVGAEKLKVHLKTKFEEKYNLQILEGYGTSECAPIIACNFPDISDNGINGEKIIQQSQKQGSVGKPLPGVNIKIIDPESKQILSPHAEGLICVNGSNVMTCYLNDDTLTQQAIINNWYHTGDIGKLDDDGFLYITARLSRFSKIAGEMVPHEAIEEIMESLFKNTETRIYVCGVPDDQKGEKLVALHTELYEPLDEYWQKLQMTNLAKLWIPKRENFFLITDFPMLASGKKDTRTLKIKAEELTKNPQSL